MCIRDRDVTPSFLHSPPSHPDPLAITPSFLPSLPTQIHLLNPPSTANIRPDKACTVADHNTIACQDEQAFHREDDPAKSGQLTSHPLAGSGVIRELTASRPSREV